MKCLKIRIECISEIKQEDIDFNIPGLPHSTVKQLHGANVRKLIQKIENHPHRQALQRDLEQSQQFNPFSEESKELIHEVGNIELCELLDVEPKAQCKVCPSYWDIGIVYCTCGHFLRNGNEDIKRFVKYTMDLLSIPYYYITKGRTHGHRFGKKPGDRAYYVANSAQEEMQEERLFWAYTTGSFAMTRSARICMTQDAMKKCYVRWINWRTRITRTTLPQKNLKHIQTFGGFVRTQ